MERRSFIRHPSEIPIEVSAGQRAARGGRHLHDVSLGGISFASDVCPGLGEIIEIRIPSVKPQFETRGRVVWCRTCDTGYEVGAQFLEETDAFRARMVEQVCHIEDYRRRVRETEGRLLNGDEAAREWIQRYASTFPDPRTRGAENRSGG